MNAERRPVVGFEGFYEVDSDGRIYSLPRVVEYRNRVRKWDGKELTPALRGTYKVVTLRGSRGQYRTPCVHTVVLEAFVGKRKPGQACCHCNGDSLDNRLANLRWDTYRSNSDDILRHGRRPFGERMSTAKLTAADVMAIREKRESVADQAARYGVSVSLIRKVRTGEAWRHLPHGKAWAASHGVTFREMEAA